MLSNLTAMYKQNTLFCGITGTKIEALNVTFGEGKESYDLYAVTT
jgi:hypothetical protein